MKHFYSASKNSFYPEVFKEDYMKSGSWPEDLVEVEEEVFTEFSLSEPPQGKERGPDENGRPSWVDTKCFTDNTFALKVWLGKRTELLNKTDWIVSRHLEEEILGSELSIFEEQFLELLQFRKNLRDLTHMSTFPDYPEFLKELFKDEQI